METKKARTGLDVVLKVSVDVLCPILLILKLYVDHAIFQTKHTHTDVSFAGSESSYSAPDGRSRLCSSKQAWRFCVFVSSLVFESDLLRKGTVWDYMSCSAQRCCYMNSWRWTGPEGLLNHGDELRWALSLNGRNMMLFCVEYSWLFQWKIRAKVARVDVSEFHGEVMVVWARTCGLQNYLDVSYVLSVRAGYSLKLYWRLKEIGYINSLVCSPLPFLLSHGSLLFIKRT